MIKIERNGQGNWIVTNSGPCPNRYSDELARLLTPEEWKVFTFAVRKIFGFQDHYPEMKDRIAVSQFVTGTGLCDTAIRRALKVLDKRRVLVKCRTPDGDQDITTDGQLFQIPLDDDAIDWAFLRQRFDGKAEILAGRMAVARALRASDGDGVESEDTGLMALDGSSDIRGDASNGVRGNPSNGTRTQKPPSKPPSKPKRVGAAAPPTAAEVIRAIQDGAKRRPSKSMEQDVAALFGENPDLGRITAVCSEWVLRGYKPTNYQGMAEVYLHGWNASGRAPAGNGKGKTNGKTRALGNFFDGLIEGEQS